MVVLEDTRQKCTIWDYDRNDSRWVIYRFVWAGSDIPNVAFYVGSGLNFSSPTYTDGRSPGGRFVMRLNKVVLIALAIGVTTGLDWSRNRRVG